MDAKHLSISVMSVFVILDYGLQIDIIKFDTKSDIFLVFSGTTL